MKLRSILIPFAVAGAVACAIGASSPSGTNLADLPGDAKLYTAEQIAALFTALDSTNAIAALEAILSSNSVLRAELMELHERDCTRNTNNSNNPLVLDPYGEQEAFIHTDDYDNMVVRMGLLENAAHGDCGYEDSYVWPMALRYASEMLSSFGSRYESTEDFCNRFDDVSVWQYYMVYGSIGDYDYGERMDALINLATAVETIGITDSSQIETALNGGLTYDINSSALGSLVENADALMSLAGSADDILSLQSCQCGEGGGCQCDLAGFVTTLQGIVSDLSSAISGLNADYSTLEARITALETEIGNLSPAEVSQRTGLPVESVTTIINDARQDAADAADACAEVEEKVGDLVAVAEAAEDLVESVIEYIGDI